MGEAYKRNRAVLLDYMGNPENEFPNRSEMALSVLGYKEISSMYKIFTKEDLTEIEVESIQERKRRSSKDVASVYKKLLKEANGGNVQAIKEYLDRIEGKVIDKKEITGKDGADLAPILNVRLTDGD
ncbi:MAG: hypothetical protein GY800_08990 [Planctomycetes bacterium]|nr:hypothetical protein [Planctomycetota bacterium]